MSIQANFKHILKKLFPLAATFSQHPPASIVFISPWFCSFPPGCCVLFSVSGFEEGTCRSLFSSVNEVRVILLASEKLQTSEEGCSIYLCSIMLCFTGKTELIVYLSVDNIGMMVSCQIHSSSSGSAGSSVTCAESFLEAYFLTVGAISGPAREGPPPSIFFLSVSICRRSSAPALLRGRQVALTLKKQQPRREQPAQCWPPSLLLSSSRFFYWVLNWAVNGLLQPVWVQRINKR